MPSGARGPPCPSWAKAAYTPRPLVHRPPTPLIFRPAPSHPSHLLPFLPSKGWGGRRERETAPLALHSTRPHTVGYIGERDPEEGKIEYGGGAPAARRTLPSGPRAPRPFAHATHTLALFRPTRPISDPSYPSCLEGGGREREREEAPLALCATRPHTVDFVGGCESRCESRREGGRIWRKRTSGQADVAVRQLLHRVVGQHLTHQLIHIFVGQHRCIYRLFGRLSQTGGLQWRVTRHTPVSQRGYGSSSIGLSASI